MEPIRQTIREKDLHIAAEPMVSPHIVDLKSMPERRAERRPDLDFGQKLAVLSYRIRSFLMPKTGAGDLRFLPKRGMTVVTEAPIEPEAKPQEHDSTSSQNLDDSKPVSILQSADPWTRQAAPAQQAVVRQVSTFPQPLLTVRPKPEPPEHLPVLPREPRIFASPFSPTWQWRHAFAFAVIGVLVTLPVYALATYTGLLHDASAVAAQTKEAFSSLVNAGTQAATLSASSTASFDHAAATFDETRGRLRSAAVNLAAFISGKGATLKDGDAVLAAGEAISKAGSDISQGFDALDKDSTLTVPERALKLVDVLDRALPHLNEAVTNLDGVNPASLPAGFRLQFTAVRTDLHSVRDNIRRFTDAAPAVMKMLGTSGKRRYLVLFQNDRELRPTGGFIGSFALMDMKDGRIVSMEVPAGGSYDLQGSLTQRLLAPAPLRLVNTRWEFQDANWFADFPTSAKNLAWFYDKSGGPTIDGVVAVTSRLMESLLKTVGPVDLPEYGKIITADNFFDETQKAVEIEYDKTTNTPKQFIADLMPKVLSKLMDGGVSRLPALMSVTSDALAAKDIQVWFSDDPTQAAAASFGWTGELKPVPNADFLSVVDSNIAGGKTDGVVSEDVKLESVPEADGSIIDTVTITRTHHGVKGDLFTGVKNIDFLRVYAPTGSELISSEGFEKPGDGYFQQPDDTLHTSSMLAAVEGRKTQGAGGTIISEESGLAVFGNWVQVEPGETRTVKISYRLPYKMADLASEPSTGWEKMKDAIGAFVPLAEWKLVVRRQAGGRDRTFSALLRLPKGWSEVSKVPETLTENSEGLEWHGPLERDLYLGAVMMVQ